MSATWNNRSLWNWDQVPGLYTISPVPANNNPPINNSAEALWFREFNHFVQSIRTQGVALQAALNTYSGANAIAMQTALTNFYNFFITNYMTTPELTRAGVTAILPKTLVAIRTLATAIGGVANNEPFKTPAGHLKTLQSILSDPIRGLINRLSGLRAGPIGANGSILTFRDIGPQNWIPGDFFELKSGKSMPADAAFF
jgi:hypothetical protein